MLEFDVKCSRSFVDANNQTLSAKVSELYICMYVIIKNKNITFQVSEKLTLSLQLRSALSAITAHMLVRFKFLRWSLECVPAFIYMESGILNSTYKHGKNKRL